MNNTDKADVANYKFTACKHVSLRYATIEDAAFILSLRKDKNLNKFLSPVDSGITKQIEWLAEYKEREKKRIEYYFIVESIDGDALGTVRLYDFKDDSFCWGSWIIIQNAPRFTALESALLVYEFAFYQLDFKKSHFDVRKENTKVVEFHKRFGAKVVGSDEDNFYFKIFKSDYIGNKKKYKKFFI